MAQIWRGAIAGRGPRMPAWRLPESVAVPAIAVLALLAGIEMLVQLFHAGGGLLPEPVAVGAALAGVIPTYLQNIPVTLGEAALGYGIGNGLALLLALLVTGWAPLRTLVYQFGLILYTLPWVVVAPLAVVYLGNGMEPRVVLAASACVFPMVNSAIRGLRAAPPGARDLFRLQGASAPERLFRLVIPYALPHVFTGLRFTIPIAFIVALVSEWSGGTSGVGTLLLYQMFDGRTMDIWASLLLIGLTTGCLFALIALLDRLAVPWLGQVGVAERTAGDRRLTPGTRRRSIQRALLLPLGAAALLIGGLVLCWAGAIAYWHLPAYQVPTPLSSWDVLLHQPEVYQADLATTVRETLAGFLLGNGLGYALALLFVVSRRTALVCFPVAIAFQAVPVQALVPLITLLLGHGQAPILCIITLVSFFPTLLLVGRSLQALGPGEQDLFRQAGAGPWETVRHLAIPASLGSLFAGLRIGATASVFGATVAEWLAGSHGLGIAMVQAAASVNLTTLWTDALLTMGLALALSATVGAVEQFVLARWTE